MHYPGSESIRYIHKVIDNRDIFYFANIGHTNIDLPLELKGVNKLEKWNPHNGQVEKVDMEVSKGNGDVQTASMRLQLDAYTSCFLIGNAL